MLLQEKHRTFRKHNPRLWLTLENVQILLSNLARTVEAIASQEIWQAWTGTVQVHCDSGRLRPEDPRLSDRMWRARQNEAPKQG